MRTYLKLAITALASAFLAAGCSGGGSSSSSSSGAATSTNLTISGKLGTSSFAPRKGLNASANVGMQAVTLADLEIYAVAFTSPPVIAQANVGSDGAFTVELTGAKGSTVTALFRDKNDGTQVGTVVFEDSSKKDLKGNSKQSSSIVLSDSVTLGNITLGSDGKVVIPVSQITSSVGSSDSVASGTAFDPTGVWSMAAFDGTLPTGYQTVGTSCNDGPCVGFNVTLIRLAGKEFTPNSSCTSESACASTAGTDGVDKYGLSIWGGNDSQGVGACGNKVGFTADAARYHAHINIASLPTTLPNVGANLAFGNYVFSDMTGFCKADGSDCTSPYNKPWMYKTATARWQVDDCRASAVTSGGTTYSAWACKSPIYDHSSSWPGTNTSTYGWNVGIEGGGCFDANNKPLRVTNWSIAPDNNSCTHTDVSSTYGSGYYQDECVYTSKDHDGDSSTAAVSYTCRHIGGQFTDSSGPTTTPLSSMTNKHLERPASLINQGAACTTAGSASNAATLAGYRCFADAYWQHASGSTGCAREYHFDWSATDPANFVMDANNQKPKESFVTNLLTYSTDGQTGTVEDEQIEKVVVSTGTSSSTFCDVGRRTMISFKKISDTKLLTDLQQSGQMLSTDAACIALAKDALSGKQLNSGSDIKYMLEPQRMMFYLTK